MANSQTAVSDKEDIPASLEARKAFQPDLYVTRQQFLALKQRVDALTLEDKDKGAKYFRANSTGPDSQATGQEAVAIGPSAIAGGAGSVAIGEGVSYPTSGRGVVIGSLAYVGTGEPNDGVVVLGCDANASGERAVAIGGGASATFTDNVAIGVVPLHIFPARPSQWGARPTQPESNAWLWGTVRVPKGPGGWRSVAARR
ncbi:hypothetical protein [Cupriavidus campinensis]|uniref:hypothetical protein n=1 Tax=Cupriavidus campinensis TaxID=151783 RepID=UPI0024C34F48|nr:hypothetical protein [Cupriavidus campinensis]